MQPQTTDNNVIIKKTFLHNVFEFFYDVAIYLIIILIIGFFVVIPFRISGNSMENSFHNKEYIIIDKFSYLNFSTHFENWKSSQTNFIQNLFGNILSKIPLHIGDPERGDVVVVQPHINNDSVYYLKRVIALPWETIRFYDGKVFIKNSQTVDFIELNEEYLSFENKNETYLPLWVQDTEFTLPDGQYWVMGDNRRHSLDSRGCFDLCENEGSTHFIARKDIVWKILLSLWYFEIFKDGKIPQLGSFTWEVKPRFFNIPATFEYKELETVKE